MKPAPQIDVYPNGHPVYPFPGPAIAIRNTSGAVILTLEEFNAIQSALMRAAFQAIPESTQQAPQSEQGTQRPEMPSVSFG